jgi:hypothetical protein
MSKLTQENLLSLSPILNGVERKVEDVTGARVVPDGYGDYRPTRPIRRNLSRTRRKK